MQARAFTLLRKLLYGPGMNRAQDGDDRARLRLAQRPAFREELLHLAVETHADENRVALRREGFRTRYPLSAAFPHRARPRCVDVADSRRKPLAYQVPDDGCAHTACADDADGFQFVRNRSLRHSPLLSAF